MLKYLTTEIVFQEVPDEVSLAFSISGCPVKCQGCHSPKLWLNEGTILEEESFRNLIKNTDGITCVLFLGGDNDFHSVCKYAKITKELGLKFAWYSGRFVIPSLEYFDYIKLGPYIESCGGLDNPNTNQKMYKVIDKSGVLLLEDITKKFQKTNL